MRRAVFSLLSILSFFLSTSSFAQTADEAPHRDEEGNWIPWYAPDPDDESTRSTVDLRFAPTETKMIGPAPAAAGATRYADYNVTYGLGLVDVSIPLYEIKSRSLTLPISLSYDSGGVRVDDISGPVGLGWTLEAGGVITRTVMGLDDIGLAGWSSRPDDNPLASNYTNDEYLANLADGSADSSADLYSYNFCGHRGSFYIDWLTTPASVIPTSATDLDFQITTMGFVITDVDGTKYTFNQQETTSRYVSIADPIYGAGSSPESSPASMAPITAWYLTEIAAMDRTDVITLSYTTLPPLLVIRDFEIRTYQFTYHYQSPGSYLWMTAGGQWGGYPAVSALTGTYEVETGWEPLAVNTISYPGGRVDFSYINNPDPSASGNLRRSYPKTLSTITVKATSPAVSSETTVLTCTFSVPFQTSDRRNLLTGVTLAGKNGVSIESYSFTYISQGSGMTENAKDLFGYYNGATANTGTAFLRLFEDNYTFNESVANRAYNNYTVSNLSLETISTASGAKTQFVYEGNGIATGGASPLFSTIGIGHRIKRILVYDRSSGSETLVRQRDFTYSSPGITIPLTAFNRAAFLTVTEVFREDLLDNAHGWWCGSSYPMPRTATVAFSDQSVLPGTPLERARIYYGTVTERISGSSSGESVRTDYVFNTTGATHPYSPDSWTLGSIQNNHDDDNNIYGLHLYHFFQRPPSVVVRQSAGPSVDLTPSWSYFMPTDFPQLTAPSTIRRYKTVGNTETLVSQITNTYQTTSELYLSGYRIRNMIALGDENYQSGTRHVEDFFRGGVQYKRIWSRLLTTTETEYLDDNSTHNASTTYTYIPAVNVPPVGSILTPKTKTTVIDGDNTRSYAWTYTYPSEQGTSAPWPTLVANGYRKPVTESVTAGTGTGSATTTRTETWASFSAKFATNKTIVRPSKIEITRREPGATTFIKGGPTVTYGVYDCWGNPLQVTKDGQPVTTYIWGYGGLRPVLEVAGATYGEVASVAGTATLNTIASGKPIQIQLSTAWELLSTEPSPKMLVSWYLYDLPFGMSQASDVSGRKTSYSYDGAGRLASVLDDSGSRINTYMYALTSGGSGSPNSINSYTHTVSGSSATSGVRDVAYFDGLGRTVQTIAVGASTSSMDLVTPVVPDFLDREDAKAYIPYPASSGTAGSYRSGALAAQQSYHGSSVRAYTENTYEKSSRNRIIASALPGFTETTTVATKGSEANTVLKLTYTPGAGNAAGSVSANGYYAANRFTVTTTTGPDGSVSAVYTDEFGSPVLERVKIDASTWADTYYIKDILGRVLCVVPPAEAAKLSSSTSGYTAAYCYTYTYDGRDRVTRRQLPGCAPETVAYYQQSDLPYTRTRLAAGSTSVNEVYTTSYDTFFRPVSETYKYGSNAAVTLAEYQYDTYPSWVPAFAAESGYVSSNDTRVRGLKTAERFALLPANVAPSGLTSSNTAAKESRAFYYDARGRVVQMARTNAQGGTDRISTKYKFTGDIEAQRQKIQPASGASTYNLDRAYIYDSRMRLTNVTATLNGGSAASQAVSYDYLQRPATTTRSCTGGSGTEASAYSYTLQGWLSSMSSTSWEETLRYTSPSRSGTDAAPGKAGIITEWTQQQKNGSGATYAETFAYTYDKAGRLTKSLRYIGTSSASVNTLTEQDITYDSSGNLLTLKRYNESSGTSPSESLSYSYTGPKRNNTGWSYDNHGNVTADPQGSMSVAWNVLDMPRTLTSGSASTQRAYLADGTLAQIYDGSTTRLYVGDMVFTRTGTSGTPALESAGWEGGRLLNGSGTDKVLYYVTDHLGSVRTIKDGSGTIRQRFDYYPFGTVSRVYTSSSSTDYSLKRYRFGGKEIAGAALTELGGTGAAPAAPYLDFGARLYSPRTATWLSVDPMAEKYYGIGPHVYCAASPLNLVDPTGKDWFLLYNDGSIRFWETREEEDFDRLFVAPDKGQDIDIMPSIYIDDKSILSSLEGNLRGAARGVLTDSPDASSIFYFLADNSNVEWTLYGFENGMTLLGSKREESTSGSYSDYGVKKPAFKIHSHPLVEVDTNSELGSMGKSWNVQSHKYELITPSDIYNASVDIRYNGTKATKSYVYFPNSKHTYVLRPDPKRL